MLKTPRTSNYNKNSFTYVWEYVYKSTLLLAENLLLVSVSSRKTWGHFISLTFTYFKVVFTPNSMLRPKKPFNISVDISHSFAMRPSWSSSNFRHRLLWSWPRPNISNILVAAACVTLRLTIIGLGDVTPMRHSELYESAPHNGSCYVHDDTLHCSRHTALQALNAAPDLVWMQPKTQSVSLIIKLSNRQEGMRITVTF